jgi:acyl-homoserine lactone acylase PvdQ
MDEQEQISKLGEVVALQRLLDSRIEQGRNRLERSEGELRHATDEAFSSFWQAITTLRDARQARNLARLKEMVNPEQWPWAEAHALFVHPVRFGHGSARSPGRSGVQFAANRRCPESR